MNKEEFQKQIFNIIKSNVSNPDGYRDMVFELNTLYDKVVYDGEIRERLKGISILGNFIGTCEGISCWNIPDELKEILKNRIKELKKLSKDWMEKESK